MTSEQNLAIARSIYYQRALLHHASTPLSGIALLRYCIILSLHHFLFPPRTGHKYPTQVVVLLPTSLQYAETIQESLVAQK